MATRQHPSSNAFEVTLFTLMVAAVATGALIVVGGFSLLTALFLGPGVGVVVAIVLSILLAQRPSRGPREPSGHAGEGADATRASRTAGGAERPATAEARAGDDAAMRSAGPGSAPSSEAHGSEPTAPRVTPAVEPLGAAAAAPVEPATLDAPRDGRADDLTAIQGIDAAVERRLHERGIYHVDQIASWGPGEVAWADAEIEGVEGRASGDDWVGQARALAQG